MNLLTVDDHPTNRKLLQYQLEAEGHTVFKAFDGLTAITIADERHPQLVVLDWMLPGMDGISVTETIRVQNNDVPILILSAKNASSDRVLGLRKGADDYLTKPITPDRLAAKLARWLPLDSVQKAD